VVIEFSIYSDFALLLLSSLYLTLHSKRLWLSNDNIKVLFMSAEA